MTESKGKRVLIGTDAYAEVTAALKRLRALSAKIKDSQLVTEIVQDFFSRNDDKALAKIGNKYFDERGYLRSLLATDMTDQELREALTRLPPRPPKERG